MKRRRINKKKFRRFLSVLFLVIIIVSGFVWFKIDKAFSGNGEGNPGDKPGIILDIPNLDKRISILLIGADQRPEEKSFNTDTLIVASVDPETKRISLLSIPRDTMVPLGGSPHVKINSVYLLTNSFDSLKEKVTELTGIPLSGYVLTNFEGFKDIIDTLDGIDIDVEKDMYFETGDKKDGVIDLKKGLQTLNGAKALQYARFRHDALADISRTQRQQNVLKAVAKKMLKLSTIPKLPWLIPQIDKVVQTDLAVTDMLKLAKAAAGFDSENVISQTLPGGFKDIDGISYWEVFPDKAKKVVEDLFNGIASNDIDVVIDHVNPEQPKPPQDLPMVPGGPSDPNGTKSPGHQDFPSEGTNDNQPKDPGQIENPSDEGTPTDTGTPSDTGNSNDTQTPTPSETGNTSETQDPSQTGNTGDTTTIPIEPAKPYNPNQTTPPS